MGVESERMSRKTIIKELSAGPGEKLLLKRFWLFALALLAVTLAAYFPAWFGKPLWDDDAHMTSPELRSWAGLLRIWTEPAATQQYYPLVHSAFWLEHWIWGDATLGYHLVNILLHVFCALLLLGILRLLEIPGAWLAAAVFALHPIEVESVAWISELKNTLSGAFYLGAALVYLRFDRSRERRFYLVALGLFLSGLFCKTVIATLPAALLLIFWWKRGKLSRERDAKPLVPFFAVGIAMGLLTAHVEKKYIIGAASASFHFTLAQRCLIAGRAVWFYIGKLLCPSKLVFIYPRWDVNPGVWWQYLFPATALALLAALWMLRNRARAPLAAALFFACTLFPALGFVNVYPFIFSFVADHFQYLAGIGIITLGSAGAACLAKRLHGWQRQAGHLFAVAILILLATLTWRQCGIYDDARTLYTKTIEQNPACWLALNNLGNDLLSRGKVEEAIADIQKAIEINPDYAKGHYNLANALQKKGLPDEAIMEFQKALQIYPGFAEAHYNLANTLRLEGRTGEAIEQYLETLQINPYMPDAHLNLGDLLGQNGNVNEAIVEFQKAIAIKPDSAQARYDLGLALLQKGDPDEAIPQFQRAIELEPGNTEAQNNLGLAILQKGDVDGAVARFQKAIAINPGYADARLDLGIALQKKGQVEEAIAQYQIALEIKPGYPAALNNLAYVLAACPQASLRNGAKAVELAEQASQSAEGKNPLILGTLAAAYAEAGRFPEAVNTAQLALDLANSQSNMDLSDLLRPQIALYQAHKPLRDESLGK